MSTSAQAKKYLRYTVEIYYPMSQNLLIKLGQLIYRVMDNISR